MMNSAPSFDGGESMMAREDVAMEMVEDQAMGTSSFYPQPPFPDPDIAPTDNPDRVVITDTSLSLVVNSVAETINRIETIATEAGGFLVNSYLNQPSEAASGSIVVRVPSDKRDQVITNIKASGLRVTGENVTGRDVTDQYVDLEAELEVLETTKTKFQAIQDQATEIQDLLTVQRELINVQRQIDNVQGRLQYLDQSANLSKITVNLATDALALPLTPDNAWRPALVYKQAVRDLLESVRSLAYSGIRFGVFSVLWIPGVIVLFIGYKLYRNKTHKA